MNASDDSMHVDSSKKLQACFIVSFNWLCFVSEENEKMSCREGAVRIN